MALTNLKKKRNRKCKAWRDSLTFGKHIFFWSSNLRVLLAQKLGGWWKSAFSRVIFRDPPAFCARRTRKFVASCARFPAFKMADHHTLLSPCKCIVVDYANMWCLSQFLCILLPCKEAVTIDFSKFLWNKGLICLRQDFYLRNSSDYRISLVIAQIKVLS